MKLLPHISIISFKYSFREFRTYRLRAYQLGFGDLYRIHSADVKHTIIEQRALHCQHGGTFNIQSYLNTDRHATRRGISISLLIQQLVQKPPMCTPPPGHPAPSALPAYASSLRYGAGTSAVFSESSSPPSAAGSSPAKRRGQTLESCQEGMVILEARSRKFVELRMCEPHNGAICAQRLVRGRQRLKVFSCTALISECIFVRGGCCTNESNVPDPAGREFIATI